MTATSWGLHAPVAPALRRGFLTAIPVGAGVLLDLAFDTRAAGAVATGALLAGFIALDAPALTRARWQLMSAPVIGAFAAVGVLSSDSAILAVAVMTVFATAAGFAVAVSPRLAMTGVMSVLALLIAQGLRLGAHDAARALGAAVAVYASSTSRATATG